MRGLDRRYAAIVLTWKGRGRVRFPSLMASDLREALTSRAYDALRLEVERRTPFLLAPVCFAIGILLYFVSEGEPGIYWSGFLALALAAAAAALRSRPLTRRVLMALCLVCAGFTAAVVRTAEVKRPVLERTTIGRLEGRVMTIETRPGQARVLLHVHNFASLPKEALPERVRVTLRDAAAIRQGDTIRAMARLLPPPEPVRPGGYHFARDAYFAGLGAVGSILGKVEVTPGTERAAPRASMMAALDRERNALNDRIASVYGGQAGAVAAALVTGKRGLIDEETNDALRASGIYHIVSISGLHMALASGALFWAFRALLALSPTLALHWPIRKIAAVFAMIGGVLYCVFSGANVATVRALIMTLIMLGAVLFDRPAFSMRNLAIAALIVMALEPDTILGPSFQMSFAAVAALIALYDRPGRQPQEADGFDAPRANRNGGGPFSALRRMRQAAMELVKTTLVASAATAPFAAYHFHVANPYSLIGNLFGLPFVSILGMPSALAGAFLYPLGLDWPFWWLMGFAMDAVISISRLVEALPTARTYLTAFGPIALMLLTTALLLMTIARTWLRWLAIVPLCAGLAAASDRDQPDILVDRQASGAAIRGTDGRYVIVGRPSSFVIEQWLAADGDPRAADPAAAIVPGNCDSKGCIARLRDGRVVALIRNAAAIPEDCARADIAILQLRNNAGCGAKLVIDRLTLEQRGAVAIHLTQSGTRLVGALDTSKGKPWTRVATQPRPQVGSSPGHMAPQENDAVSTDERD